MSSSPTAPRLITFVPGPSTYPWPPRPPAVRDSGAGQWINAIWLGRPVAAGGMVIWLATPARLLPRAAVNESERMACTARSTGRSAGV